jgi:hypothetical protein
LLEAEKLIKWQFSWQNHFIEELQQQAENK